MNIVYNKEMLAFSRRILLDTGSIAFDPFEAYGTPYGMFINVTVTGTQFIRWIRRGMKDVLPKNAIYAFFIHISNDGEVLVGTADTEGDMIVMAPCTTKEFSLITPKREVSEAYTYQLRNCKTIQEAAQFVQDNEVYGLYDPFIFFASDWVAYAKEKGYTEMFYHTTFSGVGDKVK